MTEDHFIFILLYSFIQGFTEFIPVSSSGHLNILENLWKNSETRNLIFETTAHLSTLFALTLYLVNYSSKNLIITISSNIKPIIIATFPALVVGILLKNSGYNLFSIKIIALSSIFGAILLYIADRLKKFRFKIKSKNINFLIAGLFQCLAFIPGFSRSGACITAFLLTDNSKKDAVLYSLFLSFPIIVLSFLSNIKDIMEFKINFDLFLIFIISFITAYLTLVLFIKYINRIGFLPYVIYRIFLGSVLLIFFN